MNTRVCKWTVRVSPRRNWWLKTPPNHYLLIHRPTSGHWPKEGLEILSKRCSTSRRSSSNQGMIKALGLNAEHASPLGRRSIRSPQNMTSPCPWKDNSNHAMVTHVIMEERTNPPPTMTTPTIKRVDCNWLMHSRWQNGPTNNQQTDLPEWRLPWRIATIVGSKSKDYERKTNFPVTFVHFFLLPS